MPSTYQTSNFKNKKNLCGLRTPSEDRCSHASRSQRKPQSRTARALNGTPKKYTTNKACRCISQKVDLEPKWLRYILGTEAPHELTLGTHSTKKKMGGRGAATKTKNNYPRKDTTYLAEETSIAKIKFQLHYTMHKNRPLKCHKPVIANSFQNKEEQIIETQDKPQCLVAAKATLTLTIPGCN